MPPPLIPYRRSYIIEYPLKKGMEKMFEETLNKLQTAIRAEGSIRKVADKLDLNPSTVSRWFAEGRSPDFRALTVLFEHFGVRIVFPGESTCPADQVITDLQLQVDELSQKLKESMRLCDYYQAKLDGAIEVMRALKETTPQLTASPKNNGGAEENSAVG